MLYELYSCHTEIHRKNMSHPNIPYQVANIAIAGLQCQLKNAAWNPVFLRYWQHDFLSIVKY